MHRGRLRRPRVPAAVERSPRTGQCARRPRGTVASRADWDLFRSMTTRRDVVRFIEENIIDRHIGRETHPLTAEDGLALAAALKALDGDKDGACADLERWRGMLG